MKECQIGTPLAKYKLDLRNITKGTTMEELVVMKNQQAVTTSLRVAEVFGKERRNVLRSINGLLKNEHAEQTFVKITYVHQQNHEDDIHPTIVSIEG